MAIARLREYMAYNLKIKMTVTVEQAIQTLDTKARTSDGKRSEELERLRV